MKNQRFRKLAQKDWLAFDKGHIWHPYNCVPSSLPTYPVVSADGVRLTLEDGSQLVDGMASWWAVIHGYNHPVLNEAAKSQLDSMSHVMFGGLTHKPAVSLAALLLDITPELLTRVFFVDSGSVAVEVAIKMAIQYWYSKGHPNKQKMLTVRGGYHGDTFEAMAVCDPTNGMHTMFSHVLPEHYFAPMPTCTDDEDFRAEDIAEFKQLIEQNRDEIAAVIIEPLVQGAGGMRFYCAEYLRQVRTLCDENNVLLIFDEIATGFGRTGSLFASDKAGVVPDIMCVGKAITGGYMSFGATLASTQIADAIKNGEPGVFMHGPTFMGNPLACAVATASVELLLGSPFEQRVARIEQHLKTRLSPLKDLPVVKEVRALGAIGVVELNQQVDMAWTQAELVKRGVWIRPFRNLIYVMPPYIIDETDLSLLTTAMVEVVSDTKLATD